VGIGETSTRAIGIGSGNDGGATGTIDASGQAP